MFTDPSETNGHVFRNSFCAACWRLRLNELSTYGDEFNETLGNQTLVTLQPIIQDGMKDQFGYFLYSSIERSSYKTLYAHLNDDTWYTYNATLWLAGQNDPSWDFGSIRCNSEFPEVCAHFIKFPEDENVCSGPGCGADKTQDAFGTCLDPSEYQYSDDWRKDEDFVWPKWLLMKYNNLCSSLGEKSCQ